MLGVAMETPNTPAGGQPANLPAETSAKRSGTLKMSVHIPAEFNPIAEILAAADRCRDLARLAEATDRHGEPTGKRPRPIEPSQVRDLNFALCLLALRLSACRITIPCEDSPADMLAEIATYTGAAFGRMSEAYAARQALPDHPAEAEESLRATLAAIRAEAATEAATEAAKAAAATLDRAKERSAK
jgi:hypothetical protein